MGVLVSTMIERLVEKVKISLEFDQTADYILFEGDCLDLLVQIPDRFVKLVVTSPPYNLGKPYESRLPASF